MSPLAALVFFSVLLTPPCQAQVNLIDGSNDYLTSGQLTISPFPFTGESLGPKQSCLSYLTAANGSIRVNLSPCSGSNDLSALSDKWAYNYSSGGDTFQSWGAGGAGGSNPLMCLDGQGLDYNQGSLYTKEYPKVAACNATDAFQKWVWNGTTIKLASMDYWVAFKGKGEAFFAPTAHADLAERFAFVLPSSTSVSGTSKAFFGFTENFCGLNSLFG
jgi:hypothetical protein